MTLTKRSRELFPTWSRTLRARWVIARMQADKMRGPRIPISSAREFDDVKYYRFASPRDHWVKR